MKKRYFVLFVIMAIVILCNVTGCNINYPDDYDISQLHIHTSPISSRIYVLDEEDKINDFFSKTQLFEVNYKHIADDGFDPMISIYGEDKGVEIQIVKNDGEIIYYYVSKDGVAYLKSDETISYTDEDAVDYHKLLALIEYNQNY